MSIEWDETLDARQRNSQGEEDEDLSPHSSVMFIRIDAKRLEGRHEDEDRGPSVPHGKRQVDEQLIPSGLGGMVLLDNIVNVADGRGDQEGKDESGDVMVVGPDGDEDGVEDREEREPPGDSIDYDGLCVGGSELVDDCAKEEEVDNGPSEEGPASWSEVRLLEVAVDGAGRGYGVNVGPQEEEVDDDVDYLEKNTIFPLCGGHSSLSGSLWVRKRGEGNS